MMLSLAYVNQIEVSMVLNLSKIYLTQIKKNRIIQIQYDQIETSNNIIKKQKGILEKQIKINEEKMMDNGGKK